MTAPRAAQPDEAALAEYRQIKSEQAARIAYRDNLLYVTAAATAAALTVNRVAGQPGYLLLIPAITCVLGWTYLVNDHMITAIGRYVRETLPQMRWEADHPADQRRASRKTIQLAVDLAAFCGTAAAALTAFWLSASPAPLLLAVSAAQATAVAVLGWQFTLYAGLARQAAP